MTKYKLELYVAGKDNSRKVHEAIMRALDENLKNEYELEVIDILSEPERAMEKKVFITPTLRREVPPPIKAVIGDLTKKEKILIGLDIING